MYICVYIEGYTVRLHCEYAQGGARPGSSAHTLQYTSLPVYTRDAKTPAPATAQRVYTRTTDNTDNTRVYTHTPGVARKQAQTHRHSNEHKTSQLQLTRTTHRCTAHPQTARDTAGHSTGRSHTHAQSLYSTLYTALHSTALYTLQCIHTALSTTNHYIHSAHTALYRTVLYAAHSIHPRLYGTIQHSTLYPTLSMQHSIYTQHCTHSTVYTARYAQRSTDRPQRRARARRLMPRGGVCGVVCAALSVRVWV